MKKILFLLVVFCSLQTNAQPYSISFSGTGLSTVKVQNLTTGVIAYVPAGDVLLLSTPTGIPKVNNKKSFGIKIYPNPMTDKSTLEILPPMDGDIIITICDMTGKVIIQFKDYVETLTQVFSLSGLNNGLYIVNVQGNGYQFSEKLLSNGKSTGTANILKISNNIQAVAEKKSILISMGVQGNVNMAYSSGERLIYTALSGNNSTVITDIPTANKTVAFNFVDCKDGDNNYYPVVQINTQLWMAENLKTTKYNDGTAIPNITDNTAWNNVTTGAYCDYNNTPSNSIIHGRLYNWYVVDNNAGTKIASNGGKNVCPTGWHIPSDTEWTTFENYLITNGYNWDGTTTGNKFAKSLASAKGWATDPTEGSVGNDQASNDRSGFTALPSGYRKFSGTYCNLGYYCFWWYSTQFSASDAYYRFMMWSYGSSERSNFDKGYGFSVRCLRD